MTPPPGALGPKFLEDTPGSAQSAGDPRPAGRKRHHHRDLGRCGGDDTV